MKRVLITTGPAWEPVDAIRRLTNHATGEIGTLLAETFAERGWFVTLFRGAMASAQIPQHPAITLRLFNGITDLTQLVSELASKEGASFGAILHAAALSDFIVRDATTADAQSIVASNKITSRGGDVILRLTPAPKLLPQLRAWFPKAFLVGWKYEVDGKRAEAIQKALQQLREAQTDACVLNGPAFGAGFGILRAEILWESEPPESKISYAPTKAALASTLFELVAAEQNNRDFPASTA